MILLPSLSKSVLEPKVSVDDAAGFPIIQIDYHPGPTYPPMKLFTINYDEPIIELSFAADTGELLRATIYDVLKASAQRPDASATDLGLDRGVLGVAKNIPPDERQFDIEEITSCFRDDHGLEVIFESDIAKKIGTPHVQWYLSEDNDLCGFYIKLS